MKNSRVRSRVEVVRRSRIQGSVDGYWRSGAIRRRREAQRRTMQWWVERRMCVFVKGGCWRIDCWVWMDCGGDGVDDDDGDDASDSRKKAR